MLVTKIKNDAKRLCEIETELLDAFRNCDNDEIENLKNEHQDIYKRLLKIEQVYETNNTNAESIQRS